MNKSLKIIVFLFFILFLQLAEADEGGLGGVAQNLMEPVTFFSDFIQSACLVVGSAFLFASLIKYFEHRKSPLMVPISTVIFLLIAGILLLLLPVLSFFVEGGVIYSFWK